MRARQLAALAEVAAVELCFRVAAWLLQAAVSGGYGWWSKALMAALGLLGILAHGRPGEYGLRPKSLRFSLKWSAYVAAPFALASLAVLLAAAAAGRPLPGPASLARDLLWYLVFVGLAEELFFRGYVQSRLNEVFTKRYGRFLWVEFEWTQGTMVTAVLLFGLPHLLTGVNPFTGRLSVGPLTLFVTASAAFIGLVLGAIREKTGCVIVPAVLHGSIDFTAFALGSAVGLAASNAAAGAALFAFFAVLLERLLREPVGEGRGSARR